MQALAEEDADSALTTVDQALADLPGEQSMQLVRAGALLGRGETHQATTELRALIEARPSWEIIIRSFAAHGLLPLPPTTSLDDLLR